MQITPTDMTGSATSTVTPVKQSDSIEASVPQAPQEAQKPKEEALSPKFAALAKKERALLAQKRAVEQERKALEEHKTELQRVREWQSRLTKDPYGVLLDAGLTSDQAAALLLNQPTPQDQTMQVLQQQLKQTQDELKALRDGQKNSADEQREAAKKQIFHDVSSVVDSGDQFEAIKLFGDSAKQTVVELIERIFDQEGFIMDTDQAIQEVEEELVEQALKAAQMKKVLARINVSKPKEEPVASQQQQNLQPQKAPMKTLSNRMVPSTSRMTDKERRERAIMAFHNASVTKS